MQTIIQNGNRAVVINGRDGSFFANLYVNARNGIQNADITNLRWTGRTEAGAKRWAAKQVAA
jgi:hypothetical protein